ncbi:septal ring lytic transglycosylase RlpA family protein [Vibrio mangrovi]|uniref:Endolytic peptidoglycan transglycosylase RlpA n=1 Tax=Vibrio mangrovi TaxID=474394 RepID=A0A1Y6IQ91_9VIBR|nr:septal ring lytic transglycosylase RlpA family protein [Vibrio mangrovi]MDW6003405.1 septal ring lytic transglycosylase RlpA family protein [Vibrio mangrovi]SMR99804.1 Rare lipoprotein A precursor [Vibrio mangrovi]
MKIRPFLYYSFVVLFIVGCSSSGRYDISDDVAPDRPISIEHIEDAQPQYEPYSLGGNKDYTVRGKKYHILKNPQGFQEKGIASWYGKKFHGHQTSNGEIYDMYSMTAAHKTLPIPSYVKVTNLNNGKTAVVRVNDRGPFHSGRIIDLSYAAAYKLDVIRTGTAPVQIEVLSYDKPTTPAKPKANQSDYIIQVSSSTHLERTRTLSKDLSQKLSVASYIDSLNGSHRVLLGPFHDYTQTQQTLEKVKLLGYETAFIRKRRLTQ